MREPHGLIPFHRDKNITKKKKKANNDLYLSYHRKGKRMYLNKILLV